MSVHSRKCHKGNIKIWHIVLTEQFAVCRTSRCLRNLLAVSQIWHQQIAICWQVVQYPSMWRHCLPVQIRPTGALSDLPVNLPRIKKTLWDISTSWTVEQTRSSCTKSTRMCGITLGTCDLTLSRFSFKNEFHADKVLSISSPEQTPSSCNIHEAQIRHM